MLITCIFSLLLIIMSLQTAIRLTQANDTAAQLSAELKAAKEENRILKAEYECQHSLEEIEEYAADVLGMVGRSAGQIIYIK